MADRIPRADIPWYTDEQLRGMSAAAEDSGGPIKIRCLPSCLECETIARQVERAVCAGSDTDESADTSGVWWDVTNLRDVEAYKRHRSAAKGPAVFDVGPREAAAR
jgi:hypothetical protein